MIVFLSVLAIGISFFMGYIHYDILNNNARYASFLKSFVYELQNNSRSEMLSFSDVFKSEHEKHFGYKSEVTSNDEIFEVILSNGKALKGTNKALDALKSYRSARRDDIENAEKEMLSEFDKLATEAENKFQKIGKTALIIYPMLTAMAVILLI